MFRPWTYLWSFTLHSSTWILSTLSAVYGYSKKDPCELLMLFYVVRCANTLYESGISVANNSVLSAESDFAVPDEWQRTIGGTVTSRLKWKVIFLLFYYLVVVQFLLRRKVKFLIVWRFRPNSPVQLVEALLIFQNIRKIFFSVKTPRKGVGRGGDWLLGFTGLVWRSSLIRINSTPTPSK